MARLSFQIISRAFIPTLNQLVLFFWAFYGRNSSKNVSFMCFCDEWMCVRLKMSARPFVFTSEGWLSKSRQTGALLDSRLKEDFLSLNATGSWVFWTVFELFFSTTRGAAVVWEGGGEMEGKCRPCTVQRRAQSEVEHCDWWKGQHLFISFIHLNSCESHEC